jgi:hypothetical protein
VAVLQQMLAKPVCDWFDPVVFNALLTVMPAFSPGAMVKLSNGRSAVVVAHHPDDPCRPTVQLMAHANDAGNYQKINLGELEELHITHIGQQHVEPFCFKAAKLQPA